MSEQEIQAALDAANASSGCLMAVSRHRIIAALEAAARVREQEHR